MLLQKLAKKEEYTQVLVGPLNSISVMYSREWRGWKRQEIEKTDQRFQVYRQIY